MKISRLDEARQLIQGQLAGILGRLGLAELATELTVDEPTEAGHGELTTNIALKAAKAAHKAPAILAREMADAWPTLEAVERIEVAGPGFLNFTLKTAWLAEVVHEVAQKAAEYGRSASGNNQRVLIEFVSANPVGPLVIVNGRAAAVGDSLARIMRAAGYQADREFYVNNAGNQIKTLGQAMWLRWREMQGDAVENDWPEGVYPGEYVKDAVKAYIAAHPDFHADAPSDALYETLGQFGSVIFRRQHEDVLRRFGVEFDHWTYEKDLRDQHKPEQIIDTLRSRGLVYDQDGAVWFASTRLGDDKDRVLVKSDGLYTYFVPDAAYHAEKFARGYDRVIDLLGPDHHGYIGRMRALVQALGYDADQLEILI
ncbi:MAG: arginine--tRNA ligase, partial [Firmicutes bacterium]|nr:arginine--tRNA ligase [Bacillota bacterium]